MPKKTAAVLGATGTVGQRFIKLLAEHPWFDLTEVAASARSAGKPYEEATHWALDSPMPDAVRELEVKEAGTDMDADLVFSALPGGMAAELEQELARRGHKVFSNARDLRRADGVPLVITEVNPEHFAMLDERETEGFVVTNGNCSGIIATLALAPLHRAFGLESVHAVTLQALSGAGYPGVPSTDVLDNLIPYIGGEEDKMETEPQHVLGTLAGGGKVDPASFVVSSTCTRVPVIEGHSMALHMRFEQDVDAEQARKALQERHGLHVLDLPSAPEHPVVVTDDPARPQPRRDRDLDGGMSVSVGRLRDDPVAMVKLFASGSNTVRGAAGQSMLNAEYLVKKSQA